VILNRPLDYTNEEKLARGLGEIPSSLRMLPYRLHKSH